jgi:PIN domain nuclease of toxin-antitoxin system
VRAGAVIYVSAITPIEVRYLVEKGKLPPTTHTDLMAAITDPSVALELLPIDLAVVQALDRVPRATVPDLPDRIMAATALAHRLPLVTADRKIRAAPIPTIW